ncbi:MAG: hypothetical protein IJJ76_00010 [Ruminococcus sp.]|uniref:hypothetical protein n=1 Tax=Ruminococcus sp. TaxID=41978 RepID=UPI0025DCC88D|nr:hypothetical protein [Ruminococcus sp.]MBR0528135.1 hypothetical protein [Ruminococcus sp.]
MIKRLFEIAGYTIENIKTNFNNGNSFIATKGYICVAATEFDGFTGKEMAAVSFLAHDKDKILSYFETRKNEPFSQLGFEMFNAFMNDRLPCQHHGGWGNHDYTYDEIKGILKIDQ